MYEVLVKPFLRLSFYKKCFLLILTGLALYVPYLNGFNSIHDEQYTLVLSRYDVISMIKIIATEDGHPPLHYLYAKLWISLFGSPENSILALRVSALFCFLMTALLGVFPLRRLLGEKTAITWICLIFLMPSAYMLAMNMRMYPLALFLTTGVFIYGMLAVYKNQKYDWFLFSLFTLLSLYTHYYCAILCTVIWLIVFIDLLRLKKYEQLVPFFISGTIVALLFIPWVLALYWQYQSSGKIWWADFRHVKKALMDGVFMVYDDIAEKYYYQNLCLGIFCWVLVILFLFGAQKNEKEHIIGKRAIIAYLGVLLIAFLISIILFPILIDRYLVIVAGLFYICVAVSFLYYQRLQWLFVCLLMLSFVYGYSENYLSVQAEGYRELQTYLQTEMPKKSLVLYHHSRGHLMMSFYGKNTDIYFAPVDIAIVLLQDEVRKEERYLANLENYDNIYYLFSLWNSPKYGGCDKSFTSRYDHVTHCFIKISRKKALNYIKNTGKLRNFLLQKND